MTTGYTDYRVEIKNKKLITDDGRVFNRTAFITLLDAESKDISTEKFGVIDVSSIYDLIKEGRI